LKRTPTITKELIPNDAILVFLQNGYFGPGPNSENIGDEIRSDNDKLVNARKMLRILWVIPIFTHQMDMEWKKQKNITRMENKKTHVL